jgi:cytochrome b561
LTYKTAAAATYTHLSIAVHWITAILVIALFFTHEGDRGSAMQWFHVSFGSLAGLFLLWRVWLRASRGAATKIDQHRLFNLLSDLVRWGMLLSIAGLVLTGYLLPWSLGRPIDFAGLIELPGFLPRSSGLHEVMEEIHDFLGHLIVPLVVLHVAGVIKHEIGREEGVMKRMLKGSSKGR